MSTTWKSPGSRLTPAEQQMKPPATKPLTLVEQALATFPQPPRDSNLLAAVILAQALDRLSSSLVEAAAVSTYKRMT